MPIEQSDALCVRCSATVEHPDPLPPRCDDCRGELAIELAGAAETPIQRRPVKGCRACVMEAEIGTREIPHPIDPRAHECQQRKAGGPTQTDGDNRCIQCRLDKPVPCPNCT